MVWKPKEKELTQEEAIALAKKELSPFWFGSGPLLAGIKTGARTTVYPLDPAFTENPWLIAFVDTTSFAGETTVTFLREFYRRYNSNGLRFLLVIHPRYEFQRDRGLTENYIRRAQLQFPVVIDSDGLLAQAFGAKELPKICLLDKQRPIFEKSGANWIKDAEAEIHSFLRATDPGLPLLPVYHPSKISMDAGSFDFGASTKLRFPAPGFGAPVNGLSSGKFGFSNTNTPEPGKILISGSWMQDKDRIATTDPSAQIQFLSPGASISIIAQLLSKTAELAKIVVEVNDIPAFDVFASEDLYFDDEGQSAVKIEGPRIYRLLTGLSEKERRITLKFPTVKHGPIAVFAIRFSDLAPAPGNGSTPS